ncbi:FecCD family ABC transporter permease [Haloglycomyces albus]|uniref:FecCD family ABC transporter permease n=1 Tax=Haloglycomyces albus TaxID=526067 RepID=UPI00046CC907|nr:iron ABC transporter permease [Haloglycomyces albus]
MSTATLTQSPPRQRSPSRRLGLVVVLTSLVVIAVLSLMLGAKSIAVGDVWGGLTDPDSSHYAVVHGLRLPRTILGLAAGAALGLSGALLQAATRNPLADPGLLGVNSGAAVAVVSATYFLGVSTYSATLPFAFAGAAVAATACYLIAGAGRATPAALALAGAAITAAGLSYVQGIQILDAATLNQMRYWQVGSLVSAHSTPLTVTVALIAAGLALGLLLARPLNSLALGEATARGLGLSPTKLRIGIILAVTVLAGTATAACGPIVFVGLVIPHVVRFFVGVDNRWILPYSALVGALFLVTVDILGRLLARPGEVQVGVLCAVIGGPFFLYLVSRRKVAAL